MVTNVQTVKAALGPGDELEAGPVLRGMLGWELCCHKWRIKKTMLRAQREEMFVLRSLFPSPELISWLHWMARGL